MEIRRIMHILENNSRSLVFPCARQWMPYNKIFSLGCCSGTFPNVCPPPSRTFTDLRYIRSFCHSLPMGDASLAHHQHGQFATPICFFRQDDTFCVSLGEGGPSARHQLMRFPLKKAHNIVAFHFASFPLIFNKSVHCTHVGILRWWFVIVNGKIFSQILLSKYSIWLKKKKK